VEHFFVWENPWAMAGGDFYFQIGENVSRETFLDGRWIEMPERL